MKFETRKISESIGWSLAHSINHDGKKWPKGTVIDTNLMNALFEKGIEFTQVFKISETDINEDDAAIMAANHICGDGLKVVAAGRGRANLIATTSGVFIPEESIDSINTLDDAFSAASLTPYTAVRADQLVATIKLVPYAVSKDTLAKLAHTNTTAQVREFAGLKATLISTIETISPKVQRILDERLHRVSGEIVGSVTIDHTVTAVSSALKKVRSDIDVILIMGASAISDRRDIVPAALETAGGTIIKLGMPTDPGNLLMLGELSGKHVIGLPGCARSPALNGFDFILERLAAGLPVDHKTITMMGTGGLLKEIPGRQVPRIPRKQTNETISISPIILAAGKASRAKGISKLLSKLGSQSVLETTIGNILASKIDAAYVVTGHNAATVTNAVAHQYVTTIHNEKYNDGMGSSLAAGVKALTNEPVYAMICLADMPFIRADTYLKLAQAAQNAPDGSILVPTFHGKRGHPVLWHQRYFTDLSGLSGDMGGKEIMQANAEFIIEVAVDDPGILIDLDTPEMLAQFGITLIDQ